jgi:uncharacterized protein YqjF (DUF2071 family)
MSTFLTASWENLIFANYKIDRKPFEKFLPAHTEFDTFEGTDYSSIVGFLFKDVKIKGIKFPFHHTFEEVNLRFYVRHKVGNEWRRGVVFVKEIVPKHIISFIANTLYDENYDTMPTKHHWKMYDNQQHIQYEWKDKNWNQLSVLTEKQGHPTETGSEEEFITEHYWGYAQNKRKQTTEYRVEHPKWNIHKVVEYKLSCDLTELYGNDIANAMENTPSSIFLADGSEVSIMSGRRIV